MHIQYIEVRIMYMFNFQPNACILQALGRYSLSSAFHQFSCPCSTSTLRLRGSSCNVQYVLYIPDMSTRMLVTCALA